MQAVISRVHRIVTAGDTSSTSPPSPSLPTPPRAPSYSSSPSPPSTTASGSSSPNHRDGAQTTKNGEIDQRLRLAVERLQYATLLSERKKATKLLQMLARSVATDDASALGDAAIPVLLNALVSDPRDTELMEAMLELLQELVSASPTTAATLLFEATDASSSDNAFGMQTPPATGLQICLQLLQDPSPWIRGPTITLVKAMQEAAQSAFAAAVLECKEGLRRLLEVVEDRREHIRDAALQVLVKLTEREPMVQQFLAFEDGFARLFQIIEAEGLADDGSSVVSDCLQIVNNMVRDNRMTQTLLRELPYLTTHLPELLRLPNATANDANDDGGGAVTTTKSYQKRRALKLSLQLVRFLVAGLHEGVPDAKLDELALRERAKQDAELAQIQSFMGRQTALMRAIGELACCAVEELTDLQLQALDLLELLGSANGGNQIMLVHLQSAPSRRSVLAEFVRLDCAADESPVSAAATSLLDALFRNNETTKMAIFQQLNAPPPTDDEDDGSDMDNRGLPAATPAGRVLLDALLTNAEAIVNGRVESPMLLSKMVVAWKAGHRLTSLLASSDYCKDLALRIPSEYDNADAQAVPGGRFFTRCLRLLKVSPAVPATRALGLPAAVFQVKVAVLCLLIQWTLNCTNAVREIVGSVTNLSILVNLFVHEKDGRGDPRLASEAVHLRGLVAMLLGCCLEFLVDTRQQELDEIQALRTMSPPPSRTQSVVLTSTENEMTREQLLEMISKRIGLQRFTDAFVAFQQAPLVVACARGSKSHSSRNVLPLRAGVYGSEESEVNRQATDAHGEYFFALYKKAFVALVRDIGDRIQKRIIAIYTSADSSVHDGAPVAASAVSAYQDLIRIQDQQLEAMAHELAALRATSQGHPLQNSAVAATRSIDASVAVRDAVAKQEMDAVFAEQVSELQRRHTAEKAKLEVRIRDLEAAAADQEAKYSGLSAAFEQLESDLKTHDSGGAEALANQPNVASTASAQLMSELEVLKERCDELEALVKEERDLRIQGERHFSLDRNELEMHHLHLQKEIEALRMAVAERDEQVRESSAMAEALEAGQELAKRENVELQQQLEEARRSQVTIRNAGTSEELRAEIEALREELRLKIAELELAHETQREFDQRLLAHLRGDYVSASEATPVLSNGHADASSLSMEAASAVDERMQHGVAKEIFTLLETHKMKTRELKQEVEQAALETTALETQLAKTREESVELQRRVQELENQEAKRAESDAQADQTAAVKALEEELSSLKTLTATQNEELHALQAHADHKERLVAEEIESGHREVERLERELERLATAATAATTTADATVRSLESERDELQHQVSGLSKRLESEIAGLKAAKRELEQQVAQLSEAAARESRAVSHANSQVSSTPAASVGTSLDDVYILLASLEIECETLRESLRAAKGDEAVAAAEKVSRQRGAVINSL